VFVPSGIQREREIDEIEKAGGGNDQRFQNEEKKSM
jgi:hypothetical protein